MKYKNAPDILPTELIAEIQKHFSGGLLWIPMPDDHIPERHIYLKERNELIVELHRKGISMKEISGIAKITEERVRQVIKQQNNPNLDLI